MFAVLERFYTALPPDDDGGDDARWHIKPQPEEQHQKTYLSILCSTSLSQYLPLSLCLRCLSVNLTLCISFSISHNLRLSNSLCLRRCPFLYLPIDLPRTASIGFARRDHALSGLGENCEADIDIVRHVNILGENCEANNRKTQIKTASTQ